jgi:hypothetical protein
MNQTIAIPNDLFNAIQQYLIKRPFDEVVNLVMGMNQSAQAAAQAAQAPQLPAAPAPAAPVEASAADTAPSESQPA